MQHINALNQSPIDRFSQLISGAGEVTGSALQLTSGILSSVAAAVPFLPVVGSAIALGSGLLAVVSDWRELSKLQAVRRELLEGHVNEENSIITELDAKIRWMKVACVVDLLFSLAAATLLVLDLVLTFSGMPIVSMASGAVMSLYALSRAGAFIHYHNWLSDWTARATEEKDKIEQQTQQQARERQSEQARKAEEEKNAKEDKINACMSFFEMTTPRHDDVTDELLLELNDLIPLLKGDENETIAGEKKSFWKEMITSILTEKKEQGLIPNQELLRICIIVLQFASDCTLVTNFIKLYKATWNSMSRFEKASVTTANLQGNQLRLHSVLNGAEQRFFGTISAAVLLIKANNKDNLEKLFESQHSREILTPEDKPVLFPTGYSCSEAEANKFIEKNPNQNPLDSEKPIPNGVEIFSSNYLLIEILKLPSIPKALSDID